MWCTTDLTKGSAVIVYVNFIQTYDNMMYRRILIALEIVRKAKDIFYKAFCELKKEIDRNWLDGDAACTLDE